MHHSIWNKTTKPVVKGLKEIPNVKNFVSFVVSNEKIHGNLSRVQV